MSDIGIRDMAAVRAAQGAQIAGQGKQTPQDFAYAAFDIITLGLDARPGNTAPVANAGSQIGQAVDRGRGAAWRSNGVSVKPNPYFVGNGHEEGGSPVTQRYLRNRGWKAVAGSALSGAGGIAKYFGSVINVPSTIRHGSAEVTTDLHWFKIRAIAQSHRGSQTITEWCDVIMRAKAAKAGLRGIQLLGAAVPVPLVGTLANSIAAAGKLGLKIGLHEMCFLAAIEIHWRAFQEQKISNFGNPMQMVINGRPPKGVEALNVGPASRIMTEIFARRGVTAALGSYDVASLIQEPAGWMALGDKFSRD